MHAQNILAFTLVSVILILEVLTTLPMNNPNGIIFIDDNPQDVSLVKYAISQIDTPVQFTSYESGKAFIDDLENLYAPSIACLLIDINMPLMDGFEVLKTIRNHNDFEFTPAIIFSSTNSYEEKAKAYQSGANGYVSKPQDIEDIVKAMQSIVDFWVATNERTL
ncbi:MAG: response regulator [Saprospiraceae bacterium]